MKKKLIIGLACLASITILHLFAAESRVQTPDEERALVGITNNIQDQINGLKTNIVAGTVTLTNGEATVLTAHISTNYMLFLSQRYSDGQSVTNYGMLAYSNIVEGVSFQILARTNNSFGATTNKVNWLIFNQ